MGTQEIMLEVKGAEGSGNDLLEQLAMAFKKGNGAVGFSERVVGFLRLRDDHNFCFAPGVELKA